MIAETIVVAIDGPAGSGKSSVAEETARRLGYGFLDTGAAYRALAWLVAERGADTADVDAVLAAAADFDLRLGLDPDDRSVRVAGRDVTDVIRMPDVTAAVSGVARVAAVRERINERFRSLIRAAPQRGVVVEGRDITTVVAPDAPVRILLTANAEVRARRRGRELAEAEVGAVAEAMRRRDAADSAVVDFLHAAPGVEVVDSTELDFARTVDAVLTVVDRKLGGRDGR